MPVEHTPVQEKLSVQEIMARLSTPTPASLFNASDEDEDGAAVGGPGDRVKGGLSLQKDIEDLPKLTFLQTRYVSRSTTRAAHTKACRKIRLHIASGGNPMQIMAFRHELKKIAQEIIFHHEVVMNDQTEDRGRESARDWLSEVDENHIEITSEMQIYIDRCKKDYSALRQAAGDASSRRSATDHSGSRIGAREKERRAKEMERLELEQQELEQQFIALKSNLDLNRQAREGLLGARPKRLAFANRDDDDGVYQPFGAYTPARSQPASRRSSPVRTVSYRGRAAHRSNEDLLSESRHSRRYQDPDELDQEDDGRISNASSSRGGAYDTHEDSRMSSRHPPQGGSHRRRSDWQRDRHSSLQHLSRHDDDSSGDEDYRRLRYQRSAYDPAFAMLPRQSPSVFDGDPTKWPGWISIWKNLVDDLEIADSQKSALLQQYLSEKVKKEIGIALFNPGMYREVMRMLKSNYGLPEMIATKHLDTLLNSHTLAEGDRKGLSQFILNVRSTVAVLEASDASRELHSRVVLGQVVSKLPHSLQVKWTMHQLKQSHVTLTLIDLSDWLHPTLQVERIMNLTRPVGARGGDKQQGTKEQHRTVQGLKLPPRRQPTMTDERHVLVTNVETTKTVVSKPKKADGVAREKCFACGAARHSIFHCPVFVPLPLEERDKMVREKKRCFCCLGVDHMAAACTSKYRCRAEGCGAAHHTLLHGVAPTIGDTATRPLSSGPTSGDPARSGGGGSGGRTVIPFAEICTTHVQDLAPTGPEAVLMAVIKVRIAANERIAETYALLDPGANSSLIREDVAKALKLSGKNVSIRFNNAYGHDYIPSREATFSLRVADGQQYQLSAFTTPHINVEHRALDWVKATAKWEHLTGLPPPSPSLCTIGLLIGMNAIDLHIQEEIRGPSPGTRGPYAVRTPLGWCVIGPVPLSLTEDLDSRKQSTVLTEPAQCFSLSCRPLEEEESDRSLHDLVHRSFQLEAIGIKPDVVTPISARDQLAIDLVSGSFKLEDGRCTVALPWVKRGVKLPNNRHIGTRTLFSVERRLAENGLGETYHKAVMKLFNLGFVRQLTEEEVEKWEINVIPHHINLKKPDKPRIVFNASSLCQGTSLNKCLLEGPNWTLEMVDVFFSLRLRKIAVYGDINSFFHKIQVAEKDQEKLCFWYRKPGTKDPPKLNCFLVFPFGLGPSPFVAAYCLRRIVEEVKDLYPEVWLRVMHNFYVDNYIDSFDSVEEAYKVCSELIQVLKRGDFHLAQWLSNSRELMAMLPTADLIKSELDLDLDPLPEDRALGVHYNPNDDTFRIKLQPRPVATTKREILRVVAGLTDVVGWLAPTAMIARSLLQDIWISGTGWDEEVHEDILLKWKEWEDDLPAVESLRFPRLLIPPGTVKISLNGYGDASEKAYGTSLYSRCEDAEGNVRVNFVAGKVKVAPVKPLTIPRLELLAALLTYRLASHYTKLLRRQFPDMIIEVIHWSDSQITLYRICARKSHYHPFVGNRVGEILEGSSASQWRYVPTDLNPADDISRGLKARELHSEHRFYKGPPYLCQPEETWPTNIKMLEPSADDPEVKMPKYIGAVSRTESRPVSDAIAKFSNLCKLKRVMGWVLRFVHNIRNPKEKRTSSSLSVGELSGALNACLRVSQEETFAEELYDLNRRKRVHGSSRLANLTPFIDENGVMRVGGRLGRSPLPFDTKHPPILTEHPLTTAIINHFHEVFLHASVERTFGQLRSCFWILKGRRLIGMVINDCTRCKLLRTEPQVPPMAPLPPDRVTPSHPFWVSLVDFFGPLFVSVGRRTEKRYGVLTCCATTRSIHLDYTHSMSSDSYILAHRRFVSERGKPSVIYTDNGPNLVGAEREMREALDKWNDIKIKQQMADEGIEWHFSPPYASHFGGSWESLVKSCKIALKTVLQNQRVSDEVLMTIFKETAGILNSRPLTHLSVDPDDPEPLTPNHFLLGRASPHVPAGVFDPSEKLSRKEWIKSQVYMDQIWARWMREWLPNLIESRKWLTDRANLQVGDIVLVADKKTPRGEFPRGRVVEVMPGPDGVVRVVRVKTQTGVYTRAVAKLCLIIAKKKEE